MRRVYTREKYLLGSAETGRLEYINQYRDQQGLRLIREYDRKCLRCDSEFKTECHVERMCVLCRKHEDVQY